MLYQEKSIKIQLTPDLAETSSSSSNMLEVGSFFVFSGSTSNINATVWKNVMLDSSVENVQTEWPLIWLTETIKPDGKNERKMLAEGGYFEDLEF